MVDESIKTLLKEKHGELDFNNLLFFMENTGIDFKARGLRGALGMTTSYCIYLDLDKFSCLNDKMLYFVIIHEMAHYKRINKVGVDFVIKMLSHENFDAFCEYIINEEIIADRYACFLFNLFNKQIFPKGATQRLDDNYYKHNYKNNLKMLFGVVQNNEKKYKELLESFVVNE